MRPRLLGLTALLAAAAIPAAAAASSLPSAGFTAGPAFASVGAGGVKVHHGSSHIDRVLEVRSGTRGRHHRGDRDRRDRHRDRDGSGDYYADLRDSYDINRVWASDSYNDWWHDRPDRAFPRWMQSNQECQRQYWSGGGWRC